MTAKNTDFAGLPFINVALPVMDEPDLLPRLLDCLADQSYRRFKLFVCVNQPESWWNDQDKITACKNNQDSLELLNSSDVLNMVVIDHASKGKGWTGKRHGVGWARKTLMDRIDKEAEPDDIIVSIDADTVIPPDYLLSVADNFKIHPDAVALSAPYFHNTTNDIRANRAMLRYEIYMRYYFLNLERIGSPYTFTALGSALALPVRVYRAIGGMTPKLSGEDFYFLQKLRKFGHIILWNDEIVHPEARFSDRVFFGTGPAMIKGDAGDWQSYPVYPSAVFDEILETYLLLPVFYLETIPTRITIFMRSLTNETDPFHALRVNHKDPDRFSRAFHEKFDGLRILQFLKESNEKSPSTDEINLVEYLFRFYPKREIQEAGIDFANFSFDKSPVEDLEKVRDFLFKKEMKIRANSIPEKPGQQPL